MALKNVVKVKKKQKNVSLTAVVIFENKDSISGSIESKDCLLVATDWLLSVNTFENNADDRTGIDVVVFVITIKVDGLDVGVFINTIGTTIAMIAIKTKTITKIM